MRVSSRGKGGRLSSSREGNDGDNEPQGNGVDGIPKGFLRGGYARRAEDNQGACGEGMEELSNQNATCVGVNPGDQDAHGRHGGGEGEKEGEPISPVRRGGSQIIDDWDVPGSPEKAEENRRGESAFGVAHFRESVAHPTDFLEKAGDKTESDTNEKTVRGKNRGDECFHAGKDGNDQDGGNE